MAGQHSRQSGGQRLALNLVYALWTPLCAVSLWKLSQLLSGQAVPVFPSGVLLFLSVFFVYHFQHPVHRVRQWVFALLVPMFVLFVQLQFIQQVVGVVCGVLWVMYYVRWRDQLYAKPLLIAGIWVCLTHFWPLSWAAAVSLWPTAVSRFLFIMVLAWGYDLLDIHYDQHFNTRTLAGVWGWKRTYTVSTVMLTGAAGLLGVTHSPGWELQSLPMAGAWMLLYRLHRLTRPDAATILRWKIYLDSMMLLQGALLIGMSAIRG